MSIELDKQSDKERVSPSGLFGWKATIVDEFGKKWCNCTIPNLTSAMDGIHQAYCLRCRCYWYN
jgi:hypothetical protein